MYCFLLVFFKILLCLLFFFIILLIMPVKYMLDIKIDNGTNTRFLLTYFFGLIKFEYKNDQKNKLKISGINLITNTNTKMENETDLKDITFEKISRLNRNNEHGKNYFKFDDIITFLSPTLEFINDIIENVRPKKIYVGGKVGCDNPAHTGYLCALENLICPLINIKPHFQYNFEQKILQLKIFMCGRTCALIFIFIVIKYIRNESVFSFVKSNFISKEVY